MTLSVWIIAEFKTTSDGSVKFLKPKKWVRLGGIYVYRFVITQKFNIFKSIDIEM